MKYFIQTYGCQMNLSDSERIASVLEKIGYKKALNIKQADLILVNMCSVRQSAVDRVYGIAVRFKELKTKNYKLKTILTGCVLKKDRIKFKKKFDLILDIKDLGNWPKLLSYDFNDRRKHTTEYKDYLKIKPEYESSFSGLIPIMTGCNNFCSYCAVPHARGREVSRSAKEILDEIKNLIKKNYKEIWLLGQNVNSYRSTGKNSSAVASAKADKIIKFPKLLRMINNIPGNFWIRFTSPHPKDFSDELIETMVKCKKMTPYLNLPAQSGDNKVLKRMNRPYKIERYKKIVKKIRKAFKKYRKRIETEIAISTDIIVGFPRETKKQFESTVKLFKEVKYDMAYIAKYSPRPGTTANKLKDNVSLEEKERRYKILTEILKETALENNKKYIGEEVEVLVEEKKDNFLIGKTRSYKTVKLQTTNYKLQTNLVGQFVKVKIIDASSWGLKGYSF